MSKLKKLQAQWYKKLKQSGFVDAEDNEERLKRWHGHWFRNRFADIGSFHAKSEYFYKASHFLAEYPFESDLERKFWELHVNGKSNREIEKILKINRRKLGEILHCLFKAMESWKQI